MLKLEDFKVGDTWVDGEGSRRRIIAIDPEDKARPVVARGHSGQVICFAEDGTYPGARGVWTLVRKVPTVARRKLLLYRNVEGEEIVKAVAHDRKFPTLTGFELVAQADVEFEERKS